MSSSDCDFLNHFLWYEFLVPACVCAAGDIDALDSESKYCGVVRRFVARQRFCACLFALVCVLFIFEFFQKNGFFLRSCYRTVFDPVYAGAFLSVEARMFPVVV